jgi:hypothetical protein
MDNCTFTLQKPDFQPRNKAKQPSLPLAENCPRLRPQGRGRFGTQRQGLQSGDQPGRDPSSAGAHKLPTKP